VSETVIWVLSPTNTDVGQYSQQDVPAVSNHGQSTSVGEEVGVESAYSTFFPLSLVRNKYTKAIL
jgi:hypothetical protein